MASILTLYFKVLFSWYFASETQDICLYLRIDVRVVLVVFVLVSGRRVIIYNFQIFQLTKVVYFSPINQIHCRILITALVGLKIKCYPTFTFVQNNFFNFLEIIAFQRLKMNIFTVQKIRKLHLQISLY
jgi:hypothetical protein